MLMDCQKRSGVCFLIGCCICMHVASGPDCSKPARLYFLFGRAEMGRGYCDGCSVSILLGVMRCDLSIMVLIASLPDSAGTSAADKGLAPPRSQERSQRIPRWFVCSSEEERGQRIPLSHSKTFLTPNSLFHAVLGLWV
jgi:hypothetical protein